MNPREMERYNPFSGEPSSSRTSSDLDRSYASQRQQLLGHLDRSEWPESSVETATSESKLNGHYTTSFPDPFGLDSDRLLRTGSSQRPGEQSRNGPTSNRSNSVTFLHKIGSDDETQRDSSTLGRAASQRGARQTGGFTSFLSRATSVTSSSVTDRVSGAVDSVRSAVDSLSSQIQQAVPSPSGLISGGQQEPADSSQAADFKQTAASYFASRLSSVGTSNLTGSSGGLNIQPESTATICRQRVVLILSELAGTDWAQQFNQYRRLISGASNQTSSSLPFSLFFTSQFSSSSSPNQLDGSDLIEQVSFKDVSVLANQSSATAAVHVGGVSAMGLTSPAPSSSTLPINRLALNLVSPIVSSAAGQTQQALQQQQQQQQQQQLQQQQQQQQQQLLLQQQLLQRANSQSQTPIGYAKTIRPEYVVVRQRGRDQLDHLKSIVKALDYCCVPMFEPYEVWNVFQDRQLIFAKLLRVQRQLSKENFPLIPQVFCQTHKDLLNYIQNSYISLPCLVRTGPLGKGKIRIDNLQMLKDFATIMATSEQSCTIEQFLDVKCDLIVQKLGTSLKLFKGKCLQTGAATASGQSSELPDQNSTQADSSLSHQQLRQESLERQQQQQQSTTSSLLSSLISAGASSQLLRNNSNPTSGSSSNQTQSFEKLSEVNARYRRWIEAISREFDNKLDVFCIKIVVAANDREYIVGMRNCSMEFLGSVENQEEDRRSFVELIISKMNTILPKHQPLSRETSSTATGAGQPDDGLDESAGARSAVADKRAHLMSQTRVGAGSKFGQQDAALNNRNRSVSMNQAELTVTARSALNQHQAEWNPPRPGQAHNLARRASDRSDSTLTGGNEYGGDSPPSAMGASGRQMSLGQSFFDQTSTALSSFQRQSLSFLRRLDTRTGAEMSAASGTPPLSARSDTFFERGFAGGDSAASQQAVGGGVGGQRKSHSTEAELTVQRGASGSQPPPKPAPPPPSLLMNRQSSLAARNRTASLQRDTSNSANPLRTPQNSLNQSFSMETAASGGGGGGGGRPTTSSDASPQPKSQQQPQRVIRQNSALSAFEPFDAKLRGESYKSFEQLDGLESNQTTSRSELKTAAAAAANGAGSTARPKFDSVSMISANSNGSDETTTAEDTMNNLKKTFASIFGDKCE